VLLDQSPEGREIPPPEDGSAGERVPSDLEMLARGLAGMPRQPLRMLRSLPSALPNLTDLPGANAFPGVPTLSRGLAGIRRLFGDEDPGILEIATARPPRTCFNGPASPHRSFAFRSLSLDSVKALKNEMGITVNDVVVALCTTALRNWLIERDELPDDPLVAMIPVSVRTEEQRGTFGNRISMMVVPIPTNEPDPRTRLLRTHDLLRSAKDRHSALPAELLMNATSFIPPAVAALAARSTVQILGRTRPPLNVIISNVPGPREPLYSAGAQLQANFPVSVVTDGVGLNITAMSYRDHVDFGIVSDRDQIADVWPLMDLTAGALEELEEVICEKRRPSAQDGRDSRPPREGAPRQPATA
jgi:diacylglycerol O-acyltransferase